MFIHGTITDIPTPEQHVDRLAKQKKKNKGSKGFVALGIKKRTKGKPTFFRVVFANEEEHHLADEIVDEFSRGDRVCIEAADDPLRMVWEVDNDCRTAAVIRTNGLDIRRWDGISRTKGHNDQTEWSTVCRAS